MRDVARDPGPLRPAAPDPPPPAGLLPPPPPLVVVDLLAQVTDPVDGGVWSAGERAGFPPDVAARLVERGLARPVPAPASSAKAPDGPPADKMLTRDRAARK